MPFYRSSQRKRLYSKRKYRFLKNKNTLRKIKKDIMKNNFPTKIKFLGLPEKKVMFLQKESALPFPNNDFQKIIHLTPLSCPNIISLKTTSNINEVPTDIWNWDKICILAIYIRIQPQINMFAGGQNGNSVTQVKCYYALNNSIIGASALQKTFDSYLLNYKNKFVFNSNESFSFVIRAPSTMSTANPCIHKRYEWWSLADLRTNIGDDLFTSDNDENDSMNEEETIENYGNPFSSNNDKDYLHCGYIYFESAAQCSFNVSISYKVALKG